MKRWCLEKHHGKFECTFLMKGRSGRTSDTSKCPKTENMYMGTVKLQEQEIRLICG